MKVTAVTRADTIELGKAGRAIDVMQAPIRLIATRWLYDRATAHVVLVRHVHPRLARARRPGHGSSPTPTTIRRRRATCARSCSTRATGGSRARRPTRCAAASATIFDKHDIETIAPGYGCILRGRNVGRAALPDAR